MPSVYANEQYDNRKYNTHKLHDTTPDRHSDREALLHAHLGFFPLEWMHKDACEHLQVSMPSLHFQLVYKGPITLLFCSPGPAGNKRDISHG